MTHRLCDSCGQDSAFERRVKCRRCRGLVHGDCRDPFRTCYSCRWKQARGCGIQGDMLTPASAGRAPFGTNAPTTATWPQGWGPAEARILTEAGYAGWDLEERDDRHRIVTLSKGGHRLRVTFSVQCHVIYAAYIRYRSPSTEVLEPTADSVLNYMENLVTNRVLLPPIKPRTLMARYDHYVTSDGRYRLEPHHDGTATASSRGGNRWLVIDTTGAEPTRTGYTVARFRKEYCTAVKNMPWLVCDMDDGVLRIEPTRAAAADWREYFDDGLFIVRADRAHHSGWDPLQQPLYPYPDDPFEEVARPSRRAEEAA